MAFLKSKQVLLTLVKINAHLISCIFEIKSLANILYFKIDLYAAIKKCLKILN